MTKPLKTVKFGEYTINVLPDYNDMGELNNPRSETDHLLGMMVCYHNKYDLGDNLAELKGITFNSWDALLKHIKDELKAIAVLPLRLYDYSGISMSISNESNFSYMFDSMPVGFIFTTAEIYERIYKKKYLLKYHKDVIEELKKEVKLYDLFL